MRTDKQALKALVWIILTPSVVFLILWYFKRPLPDMLLRELFVFMALLACIAGPDLSLKLPRSEKSIGLAHIRRLFKGGTAAFAGVAVASFPDDSVRISDLMDYGFTLVVFSVIAIVVVAFNLAMLYPRKVVIKIMLKTGIRVIAMSAITALLIGMSVGQTPMQMLWYFFVILCVYSNLSLPGNVKLAAASRKAEPFARVVIHFLDRIAFASGIVVILALPFVETGWQSEYLLSLMLALYLGHWVYSRQKAEQLRPFR